ncbi:unnamed protein product [Protopolystoma xenopodis]|uniref:Uncharacterized protein n=1 Tax=Protopolystoma xenopodis TaxID=117903 RepID=A0A448XI58_9PLAT|nr:unnamed protein product [Protopolystoma xenopodis]
MSRGVVLTCRRTDDLTSQRYSFDEVRRVVCPQEGDDIFSENEVSRFQVFLGSDSGAEMLQGHWNASWNGRCGGMPICIQQLPVPSGSPQLTGTTELGKKGHDRDAADEQTRSEDLRNSNQERVVGRCSGDEVAITRIGNRLW